MSHCIKCGKTPDELHEYVDACDEWEMTPTEYVRRNEGTYNSTTQKFWCTECYIALGSPLGVARYLNKIEPEAI